MARKHAQVLTTTDTADTAASYDFQRPPRLSPTQVRVLNRLHEQVALAWEGVLGSIAGMPVRLQAQPAQEHDGAGLLEQSLVAVTFTVPSQAGRGAVCFDVPLALALVEGLLGGKPTEMPLARPLTDVELSLLRRLTERLLPDYGRTWRRLCDVELRIGDSRTGSGLASLVGQAGACLVPLTVTMGEVRGTITLCLPMPEADPMLSQLNLQAWISGRDMAAGQPAVLDLLQESRVPVRAVLGSFSANLAELAALRPGDVLCLPGMSGAAVTVSVANQPKFLGKPCQHNGSLVIQLQTALVSEEVPSHEDGR